MEILRPIPGRRTPSKPTGRGGAPGPAIPKTPPRSTPVQDRYAHQPPPAAASSHSFPDRAATAVESPAAILRASASSPARVSRPRPGCLHVFSIECGCPVSISYSTQPNAKMSVRGPPSALSPVQVTCRQPFRESHLPWSAPSTWLANSKDLETAPFSEVGVSNALANPKSEHFHFAARHDFHVGGLQVAMDDTLSCAASSASQICMAIAEASSSGSAPRFRMTSARVSPSTNSRTRKRVGPLC